MFLFKNFKTAHEHYKFKGSYRHGTVGDEKGVIRSYSNGNNGDLIKNNGDQIWYKIKNLRIRNLFKLSARSKRPIRVFVKVNEGVLDMGLYLVYKITQKFAILIKS